MPPMKMIIVDNSPETRNRLLGLIAQVDGIDVVGMADDAKTGMLLAKAHRPDLAIVNLQLEEEAASASFKASRKRTPSRTSWR
jgi:DNA-binding NarL/FixJ family response regulator